MYENKPDNIDYVEYYMLNAWWGQDWLHCAFCCMCGYMFDPDTTGNVYKLKFSILYLSWYKPNFSILYIL